jgi:hypothetical protein
MIKECKKKIIKKRRIEKPERRIEKVFSNMSI